MWALAVVIAVVLAAGCAGADENAQRKDAKTVVASFYPLAWVAEQIAGSDVEIVNITQAGAEPHDLELSSGDIERIREAELLVYAGGGFQPAVEDAVADRRGASLDVLDGDVDPHVWLDPIRFAQVGRAIGSALGRDAAAEELAGELAELDDELHRGLQSCSRRTLVTTHAAFGRLAKRYGLVELALAGRSPEAEPGPRELEDLAAKVRQSGATTVFAEPLASDRLAETVAREAGAKVTILDPIEGLSDDRLAAGEDYFSLMRDNLVALRKALECR